MKFLIFLVLASLLWTGITMEAATSIQGNFNFSSLTLLYDSATNENSMAVCHNMIDFKGPTFTVIVKGNVFYFILFYLTEP